MRNGGWGFRGPGLTPRWALHWLGALSAWSAASLARVPGASPTSWAAQPGLRLWAPVFSLLRGLRRGLLELLAWGLHPSASRCTATELRGGQVRRRAALKVGCGGPAHTSPRRSCSQSCPGSPPSSLFLPLASPAWTASPQRLWAPVWVKAYPTQPAPGLACCSHASVQAAQCSLVMSEETPVSSTLGLFTFN